MQSDIDWAEFMQYYINAIYAVMQSDIDWVEFMQYHINATMQ